MVIDVVGGLEDSVLKSINNLVIASNNVLTLLDQALDLLLTTSQVLNHETQIGILLVVLLELPVHLPSLPAELNYGLLSWGYVLIELLDLEIENEFEFFKLLCSLFKTQNELLLLRNDQVFGVDLLSLVLPGLFKLLDVFLLVV